MKLLNAMNGGWMTEDGDFPRISCTVPNANEAGIVDSEESFLCVVVDGRFPSDARVKILFPYTAQNFPGESPEILYGWVDEHGNLYDSAVRSINDDDEQVVAWKKVDPFDFREV